MRSLGGDYEVGSLARAARAITGDVVAEWFKHSGRRKTLLYACNVQHSRELCKRFEDAGARAAHIDGKMSAADRNEVLRQLREGEIEARASTGNPHKPNAHDSSFSHETCEAGCCCSLLASEWASETVCARMTK